MQDVPQALLLMSGGQLVVLNIGSFNGAHLGVVHAPELPAEPTQSSMATRVTPPRLQLPEEYPDDRSEDPEVHPGPAPTNAPISGGILGSREIEDDDFDDENGADQENESPRPAVPSSHSQLEPLAPSTSQHVCFSYSSCSSPIH